MYIPPGQSPSELTLSPSSQAHILSFSPLCKQNLLHIPFWLEHKLCTEKLVKTAVSQYNKDRTSVNYKKNSAK